jgi:hypothetical protein
VLLLISVVHNMQILCCCECLLCDGGSPEWGGGKIAPPPPPILRMSALRLRKADILFFSNLIDSTEMGVAF